MTSAAPMRFALPDGRALAVNTPSADALLDAIAVRLDDGQGFSVATLNLDHLVKLRRDAAFREAYLVTDFVVADGNPVVWLSRLAGRPVALAPGSELVHPICALAARRGAPVALFGATDATLEAAGAALRHDHPGLAVIHTEAPPMGFDPAAPGADAALARIAASGARLCLLALGAPKQEILAARGRAVAPTCGFVSVGAGLDFIAGSQTRAPVWVRRLALEWLWRAASDPRRLAGRYAACASTLPALAAGALRLRGMAR